LIYIGLFQAWATPQGDWAVVIWVIAMTLSGIGTVIQSWAIVDLGMAGTSGWNVGLVTTGSYRYCRHPQYFGQALGFVGFAILLGHGVGWAIGLAAVATLFYASYVEDRAMAARQGDFAAYKARTPFVLPLGPR
jgi:protein-S-isoprenylcysteine O-methyltransferase Ste14